MPSLWRSWKKLQKKLVSPVWWNLWCLHPAKASLWSKARMSWNRHGIMGVKAVVEILKNWSLRNLFSSIVRLLCSPSLRKTVLLCSVRLSDMYRKEEIIEKVSNRRTLIPNIWRRHSVWPIKWRRLWPVRESGELNFSWVMKTEFIFPNFLPVRMIPEWWLWQVLRI